MYNSEHLQEKWQPVLNHPDLPEISDSYKRAVTQLSWKTKKTLKRTKTMLMESEMQTDGTYLDNWDPVLISLVRRAMPHFIAYDVVVSNL